MAPPCETTEDGAKKRTKLSALDVLDTHKNVFHKVF